MSATIKYSTVTEGEAHHHGGGVIQRAALDGSEAGDGSDRSH